MYYWLKETDDGIIYVISDDSDNVYEIIDGNATLAKMNKFQLSKFKPYLVQFKTSNSLDVSK